MTEITEKVKYLLKNAKLVELIEIEMYCKQRNKQILGEIKNGRIS